MTWFEQFETHLPDLYILIRLMLFEAFKLAFRSFFCEELGPFKLKMFHNLDHSKLDVSLIVSKGSLIEPENNNAFSKSEIETQMQRQEEKVNMRKAVDAGLVVTESSGTKPDKQNTSSSSGSYTTQAVDADIGPVHDDEPFAEVQLTALHNILDNEQQHTEQSKPSYDTHLLETIDSNTTPTSNNYVHTALLLLVPPKLRKYIGGSLLSTERSGGMFNVVPLVDHYRNSSFFYGLQKICLSSVPQDPRNYNLVEKNHTNKPGRQNGIGQRFSLNKSSIMHEKPHTPRSCLRWKPMGRIFKTVSLRWIPTGKVFIDSTTKVDSKPPNGSNDDITNPYECNQTLYVSAGTSNSSAGTSVNPLKERFGV
ncbi:hypothetical protein Tco_1201590 [Tanacetum coccineum]